MPNFSATVLNNHTTSCTPFHLSAAIPQINRSIEQDLHCRVDRYAKLSNSRRTAAASGAESFSSTESSGSTAVLIMQLEDPPWLHVVVDHGRRFFLACSLEVFNSRFSPSHETRSKLVEERVRDFGRHRRKLSAILPIFRERISFAPHESGS